MGKIDISDFIIPGQHLITDKPEIIPVSPKLDIILNGGLTFGSFVVINGPPKKGKSSTVLDIIGTALRYPYQDRKRNAYYFDVESRLEERNITGVQTLVPFVHNGQFNIVRSKEGRILSAEDYVTFAEEVLNTDPGCICVIDSLSQLCSRSAYVHDWNQKYRDDVPSLLSLFIKRTAHSIRINKCLFIGITHRIANTAGSQYQKWMEASGIKVQYRADTKLNIQYAETLSVGGEDGGKNIGLNIHWECSASPLLNGPSTPTTNSYFRFGYGLDKPLELLELCSSIGLIRKKGSWYEIDYPELTKVQGSEKVRQILMEPKVYDYYHKQYREMMGLA